MKNQIYLEDNKKMREDEETCACVDKGVSAETMIYKLDDSPVWYVALFLGFQQFLTTLSGTISTPILISSAICMANDNPAKGYLASSVLFLTGISTLIQVTIGIRLPLVQGPSWTFIPVIYSTMALSEWKCSTRIEGYSIEDQWMARISEISGAALVGSLIEAFIGFSGLLKYLLKIITPMTVTCTIIALGIGFFKSFQTMASKNWLIAIFTLVVIIIFSQYLANVKIVCKCFKNTSLGEIQIFKLFPIMLGICVSWCLCAILTYTNVFSSDDPSRTDLNYRLLKESVWFRLPYPFQWGYPTISLGTTIGMIAGIISSIFESIGDYLVCAKISGARAPPLYAINRGIGVEGLGGVCTSLLCTAVIPTSYSSNIGVIGVTKVASRRVIIYAAMLMILFGIFTKFGAFFMLVPEPVLAGAFILLFSMILGIGFSMLQKFNMNCTRNLFIIGFSILFSLILPGYIQENPQQFRTGNVYFDQVVTILLSTNIFVAGFIAALLDSTVPGNDEDRGLVEWKAIQKNYSEDLHEYKLPYINKFAKRYNWINKLPFISNEIAEENTHI